jgi:acyl carrier protein
MQRDISAKIKEFVRNRFPLTRTLGDEDRLLGNGALDSLGILDVVSFLESEFHITISDDELVPQNFNTFINMSAFVQRKVD